MRLLGGCGSTNGEGTNGEEEDWKDGTEQRERGLCVWGGLYCSG